VSDAAKNSCGILFARGSDFQKVLKTFSIAKYWPWTYGVLGAETGPVVREQVRASRPRHARLPDLLLAPVVDEGGDDDVPALAEARRAILAGGALRVRWIADERRALHSQDPSCEGVAAERVHAGPHLSAKYDERLLGGPLKLPISLVPTTKIRLFPTNMMYLSRSPGKSVRTFHTLHCVGIS